MQVELVTIAAGAFVMGSAEGQPDEQPVHEVWLDEFRLAVHPVTNREYGAFLDATGRRAPGMFADPRFHLPAQPVVMVSWFDAVAYCDWLAGVAGRPYRLPTEAEREKAALGGARGIRYPWGDDANARENDPRHDRPQVVGLDTANGFGLHNMGDLVHEWCSDWYEADYYRHAPARNPSGPKVGTRRSSRGGSWRHQVCVTRCAARSSIPPGKTYADYGFRVAVGKS